MNFQIGFWKIMLRLWTCMLSISLLSTQLTKTANAIEMTTAAPAAAATVSVTKSPALEVTTIENDVKVLRLATIAATMKLILHDVTEDYGTKAKLSTITEQYQNQDTATYTATTPSISTYASSNAPATTTNQAKETVARQEVGIDEEQQGKYKEALVATTNQYKNNDALEREMKETDLKQVTEKQQQQQQQHQPSEKITTEVSWQRATDMHKQTTENARNAEDSVKIATATTATIATPIHTSDSSLTLQHETDTATSTTLTHTRNVQDDMDANATTMSPIEESTPDHIKQKEIAGDTGKPANDEIQSIALNPPKDREGIDDFKSIIKDANDKLIKERTIFSNRPDTNNEEWKQNLMPNELDYEPTSSKTYGHNINNWSPYLHPGTPVTDFTGKLLQEQDGVITEIEQKFRLNEFDNGNEAKTTKNPYETTDQQASLERTQTTTFAKAAQPATPHSINYRISVLRKGTVLNRIPTEFIERRVKKSFDFPMHRVASDAQHLQQHFDFASTKFNSNNNEQHNLPPPPVTNDGIENEKTQFDRPQPEFSTTKFYNSKELYNELLQHKTKLQQQEPLTTNSHDKDFTQLNNNKVPSLALNSFAVLHSPKIAKLEEIHEAKEPQQLQKSLAIKKVTVKASKPKAISSAERSSTSTTTTTSRPAHAEATTTNIYTGTTKGLSPSTLTEMPLAVLVKTPKFQKELKRAQLLIKSMMPLQNRTATATAAAVAKQTISNNNESDVLQQEYTSTLAPLKAQTQQATKITSHTGNTTTPPTSTRPTFLIPSRTSTLPSSAAAAASFHELFATATNPSKTALHPILRPRILSRLQEKINSLECEIHNLPQDSHLWRGNETHELLLPIMICKPFWTPTSWFANNRWVLRNSRNCSAASDTPENCKNDKECTAMMVSWEGEAEIQSGDILIVEINDALLTPKDINLTTSPHNTQVYQVTRSGHEHCDVTEGILLDITPLIVDGRKLVTLYDKDLTEGVNLLIVVSELWGAQCVRLKVTTKTENCGESADCSGKGICFSNYDMEEYECQCCSGFAGSHCEEIDACTPSPCTNNGICVDLSQGHEGNSYQCLCPYGYTGKNCQYELDPCNPAECMNGGSCVGNSTHFRCECTAGYTGPVCQHSLNECESSPCIHGICVDQEDGFRCFCQPGFAGELCNFEYNECESNPCQNAGECIDHIGSYECHCSKGYTGNRCQIKVDFCANKPCPEGRRCIDHGNDYSCECPGGRNGPDCNEMQRTQCNVNPCTHGGTCWSSGDSFYCACRPGYTGTMCEDEFVVETVVSSSEFIVDDTSARNFNDKSFGSTVVLKSPIELHNAYTAAIVLALVIFFVALYLIICHCKVNQTYRKFSTRTYGFLPIFGFRLRTKQATSKISRHWLSGKGLGIGNVMRGDATTSSSSSATSALHASAAKRNGHLPNAKASSDKQQQYTNVGQLNERPFQRHLAMNLENDMYYTVDFSENSQHSPLIQ